MLKIVRSFAPYALILLVVVGQEARADSKKWSGSWIETLIGAFNKPGGVSEDHAPTAVEDTGKWAKCSANRSSSFLSASLEQIRLQKARLRVLERMLAQGFALGQAHASPPSQQPDSEDHLKTLLLQISIEASALSGQSLGLIQRLDAFVQSGKWPRPHTASPEESPILNQVIGVQAQLGKKLRALKQGTPTAHETGVKRKKRDTKRDKKANSRASGDENEKQKGMSGAVVGCEAEVKKYKNTTEKVLATALSSYVLRATCKSRTLYLPPSHILRSSCTHCACQLFKQGEDANAPVSWSPMFSSALGWKFPAIYLGNGTYPGLDQRWTSQAGQDRSVVDIFKGMRNGFFIDLASSDAIEYSNTLTLEQKYGWNGLCIEPNPKHFKGLLHRKCELAVAVAGRHDNEEVDFSLTRNNDCGIVSRPLPP